MWSPTRWPAHLCPRDAARASKKQEAKALAREEQAKAKREAEQEEAAIRQLLRLAACNPLLPHTRSPRLACSQDKFGGGGCTVLGASRAAGVGGAQMALMLRCTALHAAGP